MTGENFNYRTSPFFLRNQFAGNGKLQIPIIPKFQAKSDDFENLLFIGFDKTDPKDQKHLDRMVHFFLYDYRFERVWKRPDDYITRLSRYRAVLSPDFSMYLEMAPILKIYNVFRNRWCGAYWASKGIRVIPTINWGDESTFDFCFDGVEKGSIVAVSTYPALEHNHSQGQKEWFMAGYNEMIRRIEPEKIICYNKPLPEMQGDLIYVDYERSSWRYLDYEPSFEAEDLSVYKIGFTNPISNDIIDYTIGKGSGSAFGGGIKWRPSKPEDERLIGKPGEIKESTAKNGTKVKTKIGPDGLAIRERHYTSAPNPKFHSDPHDHTIDWGNGFPSFSGPISYFDGAIPEFMSFIGGLTMTSTMFSNDSERDRFQTVDEFKDCIGRGGEVVFQWRQAEYGVGLFNPFLHLEKSGNPKPQLQYCVAHTDGSQDKWYSTPDDVLEYMIGNERLGDIITKAEILYRTI